MPGCEPDLSGVADEVEAFVRLAGDWGAWHNAFEHLVNSYAGQCAPTPSAVEALLAPYIVEPRAAVTRVLGEHEGQELMQRQQEVNERAARLRRAGRALAPRLVAADVDPKTVLRVVFYADGGGGAARLLEHWAELRVELEGTALALRARQATVASPSARTDEPMTLDRKRLHDLREVRRAVDPDGLVVGSSPGILRVFAQIAHANAIDGGPAVLLLGERGVGKTHVAALVHRSSKRAHKTFKTVNSAGGGGDINLQRGEWIGYGSGHGISGISRNGRPGHLMATNGGTLFIDEFATFSPELQAIFLSVLERRALEMVGGDTATPDVRCVFATNADVDALAAQGRLRPDLLARIPVRISIPPLRHRRGDILALARHFATSDAEFAHGAHLALMHHDWPDNVREVASVVTAALARMRSAQRRRVEPTDLDLPQEHVAALRAKSDAECRRALWTLVDEVARAEGYDHGAGLQRRAAEILGVGEPYASRMYDELGLGSAAA